MNWYRFDLLKIIARIHQPTMKRGKPTGAKDPDEVILLVHGIRTTAAWAEMVVSVLGKIQGVRAIPIRYGFFDTLHFLLPTGGRRRAVERVQREIRTVRSQYRKARISVICHSFGTYIVSKILESESDIEIHRLVLCGSIVPEDYRWDLVRSRIDTEPISECGTGDIWPILARATTWGYGASGTFGFGSVAVRDRFHPFGHSGFFDQRFVETYWRPFFETGKVGGTKWEVNRPPPPWWMSILAITPLRWLAVATLIVLAGLAGAGIPNTVSSHRLDRRSNDTSTGDVIPPRLPERPQEVSPDLETKFDAYLLELKTTALNCSSPVDCEAANRHWENERTRWSTTKGLTIEMLEILSPSKWGHSGTAWANRRDQLIRSYTENLYALMITLARLSEATRGDGVLASEVKTLSDHIRIQFSPLDCLEESQIQHFQVCVPYELEDRTRRVRDAREKARGFAVRLGIDP